MKKGWIILFLFVGILGCQDVKRPEKPKNLIAKDKMVDIITEAYLANAARSVDNRKILENGLKLDSMIYKKYDIDSVQFAKSNAFYADEMNTYIEIFQKVEERYNGMLKKMDSVQKLKRKQDSINGKPKSVKEMAEGMKDSLI